MVGGKQMAGANVALEERLRLIEARLESAYGRPMWRSSGDPLDELIATVLSQHTSDLNTERAFTALRGCFPTWRLVMDAPARDVADAIRCGGLADIKAPRIQRILRAVQAEHGDLSLAPLLSLPLAEAKSWLRRLPGVGPKTAACVLLFSLGLPVMPVDTHVHRVTRRLGLVPGNIDANAAHDALDMLIGPDRDRTYALHMNIIRHGRAVCRARFPSCADCALADLCPSAFVTDGNGN